MSETYTPEQTKQLLELYETHKTEGLEEVAKIMGKPIRSVRSKLVRLGVYIPQERVFTKRSGLSKKELLIKLENLTGLDSGGLIGSNKSSLMELLEYIQNLKNQESET